MVTGLDVAVIDIHSSTAVFIEHSPGLSLVFTNIPLNACNVYTQIAVTVVGVDAVISTRHLIAYCRSVSNHIGSLQCGQGLCRLNGNPREIVANVMAPFAF